MPATLPDKPEIPDHEIPETSANGVWKRGLSYTPEEGFHNGHIVTVVNPQAEIQAPFPTRKKGEVVIELRPAKVVYVRCESCLMSWFFDEESVL